ncbi:hypothetical protein SD70_30315, partial [Gordoniibacillus kamchatkensis]
MPGEGGGEARGWYAGQFGGDKECAAYGAGLLLAAVRRMVAGVGQCSASGRARGSRGGAVAGRAA